MDYLPTGRALIDPFNALEKAGIREEMRVADFGVGTVGHFLFPAAQLVGPKGHVYGVDVLQSVLQANQSRIKLAGADNVELVWGDFERLGGSRLPDTSMDMVVMVWKSNWFAENFGSISSWADSHLGGMRVVYKVLGCIILFISFLVITNLHVIFFKAVFGGLFGVPDSAV